MKIKVLLLIFFICVTGITYAQTTNEPATMLMSDAPAQIDISLVDGSKFRARKVAELSNLDFKSVTSFTFYYPDENNSKVNFDSLLDSLLNGSPNLEVLKFSYGNLKRLPEITNINTKLKKLDLSHNKLEIQPIGLENFSNLEHLNLEDNELKALPESLALLKNLNFVNFSFNSIDEELFMQSISLLKYKGTLRLLKLGLTDKNFEEIRLKLKQIEVITK